MVVAMAMVPPSGSTTEVQGPNSTPPARGECRPAGATIREEAQPRRNCRSQVWALADGCWALESVQALAASVM